MGREKGNKGWSFAWQTTANTCVNFSKKFNTGKMFSLVGKRSQTIVGIFTQGSKWHIIVCWKLIWTYYLIWLKTCTASCTRLTVAMKPWLVSVGAIRNSELQPLASGLAVTIAEIMWANLIWRWQRHECGNTWRPVQGKDLHVC